MKPRLRFIPTIIFLLLLGAAYAGWSPISRYIGHIEVIYYTDDGAVEFL